MKHKTRFYRDYKAHQRWTTKRICIDSSDIYLRSSKEIPDQVNSFLQNLRDDIQSHIRQRPDFLTSLTPLPEPVNCAAVLQSMYRAAHLAGVGPMAAVAGAISEHLGRKILDYSDEIIVENGGDIWMQINKAVNVTIYSGDSAFKDVLGLRIRPEMSPCGICTSSGRLGHSLSLGKAHAVTVISDDAAIADAFATETANRVKSAKDLQDALDYVMAQEKIRGALLVYGDTLAAQGEIELINPAEETES